jgi:simple sugar transport system substrate-binding protein
MKKHSLKLLAFLTVVLMLALCGDAIRVASAAAPANDTYVIANTPKCIGIAWWDRMEVGNKRFVAATGNEVYQSGPPGQSDPAVQLTSVEDAIAAGVNAITVIPASPESLEPVLKRALDEGIVVISHEATNQQNVNYDLEAFNNEAYGAHMMDVLAEQMGKKGGYMIMVGALTMTSHQQWSEGAIKRQKEAYPDMFQVAERVESQAGGGSQEGSYLVAKEVISKYPDIKGFIGCDMVNPPGIAMAVEEAGKANQIVVTGTCLVSVARDYLTKGTIKTIMFWDPADAGEAMCNLALKILKGEEVTDGVNLGVPGYEKCSLNGKTLFGSAWVDVTTANMADYDF